MSEYDVILEYTSSQDMVTTVCATHMLAAAWNALDDAIFYRDARFIASIEVRANDDKERICKH